MPKLTKSQKGSSDPVSSLLDPQKPQKRAKNRAKSSVLSGKKLNIPATGSQLDARPVTEKMARFAEYVGQGTSPPIAARMAGYSGTQESIKISALQLRQDPRIDALISKHRGEFREASLVTKREVVEGFKEAIEMGKAAGEGITMVAGWREIAKLMGFYEPKKIQVDMNVTGEAIVKHVQGLSDAALLKMLQDEQARGALASEGVEDGHFVPIQTDSVRLEFEAEHDLAQKTEDPE